MAIEIPVFSYEFNGEVISLLPIGDLHIGSAGSYWRKALEVIESYKDSYIIYLGDVINNSTKHSIGNIYEEELTPSESIKVFRDNFLVPFKDRILGVVLGNHEYRSLKETDDSTIENICYLLDIPFAKYMFVLDISVKGKIGKGTKRRTNYSIAVTHGSSGGRFMEKSARQSRYFADTIEGVDAYIAGHTHIPTNLSTGKWKYDSHNKKVTRILRRHITIPSWVNDYYAQQKMFPPSPITVIEVLLYAGREKKIVVKETGVM